MNTPNQLRPRLRLLQPVPGAIDSDDIRPRLADRTSRGKIRRNVNIALRIVGLDKVILRNDPMLSTPSALSPPAPPRKTEAAIRVSAST
jgi:hypothetical protein